MTDALLSFEKTKHAVPLRCAVTTARTIMGFRPTNGKEIIQACIDDAKLSKETTDVFSTELEKPDPGEDGDVTVSPTPPTTVSPTAE